MKLTSLLAALAVVCGSSAALIVGGSKQQPRHCEAEHRRS